MSTAIGISDRIHLLGFRTDIPNVLRGCDFFVLPTHQEALGQSYIEAMAAGLPVIGTDVDGVPELITHGVNGLLVPPHDIVALRAAMARLIDNPRLRTQLGVAGRLLTDASFTVDGMADETIDFYAAASRTPAATRESSEARAVPVLMYHHISTSPGNDHGLAGSLCGTDGIPRESGL